MNMTLEKVLRNYTGCLGNEVKNCGNQLLGNAQLNFSYLKALGKRKGMEFNENFNSLPVNALFFINFSLIKRLTCSLFQITKGGHTLNL